MVSSKRIGLLAGEGNLPQIWARAARERGREVYAYNLRNSANKALEGIADQVKNVDLALLDQLIKDLAADQIKELVMIGKVDKSLLFQEINLDRRFKALLGKLKDLNNDSILLGIVNEFTREGIEVLEQSLYLEDLVPGHGILTKNQPDEQLISDIKYAFKMAREIGRIDIGQTIVVQNRTVLAIETIEGTDAAIRRGGQLGGPGAVIAKAAKPQQDFRFDLPVVGEDTLNTLIEVKAKALVIEAESTILLDKELFIEKAAENGIVMAALNSNDLE